jgi:hypothetical protein
MKNNSGEDHQPPQDGEIRDEMNKIAQVQALMFLHISFIIQFIDLLSYMHDIIQKGFPIYHTNNHYVTLSIKSI